MERTHFTFCFKLLNLLITKIKTSLSCCRYKKYMLKDVTTLMNHPIHENSS